jgi:enoyl-CoA hydratase/carnithine racemase
MSDDLLYTVQGEIGHVIFNRPAARNALTFGMYERLAAICRSVPTDGSVKAIVMSGAGGQAFAAGTDISLFRDFSTPAQGIAYEKAADVNFTAIEECPVPTIAAISGACTGGGAGIAACCDMRIGTKDLRYGFPIARTLGNCLSSATLSRLVALVGQARVIDLIYTSRLLEADEAHRIGLVTEIVENHDAVIQRAMAIAQQLSGHAPMTMRVTKELLRRMRQALPKVDDDDLIAKVYTSNDFREGLDAFLTKRKPKWTGT